MDIVVWIAIWGAFLSTVLGVIRVVDFRRNRANIQVEVTFANPIYGDTVSKNVQLVIKAINKGRRKVKLEAAGLSMSDGRTIPFINDIFGNSPQQELDEGDSKDVFFELSAIRKVMKDNPGVYITHAWYRDRVGNYHKRKISNIMQKEIRN